MHGDGSREYVHNLNYRLGKTFTPPKSDTKLPRMSLNQRLQQPHESFFAFCFTPLDLEAYLVFVNLHHGNQQPPQIVRLDSYKYARSNLTGLLPQGLHRRCKSFRNRVPR